MAMSCLDTSPVSTATRASMDRSSVSFSDSARWASANWQKNDVDDEVSAGDESPQERGLQRPKEVTSESYITSHPYPHMCCFIPSSIHIRSTPTSFSAALMALTFSIREAVGSW